LSGIMVAGLWWLDCGGWIVVAGLWWLDCGGWIVVAGLWWGGCWFKALVWPVVVEVLGELVQDGASVSFVVDQ
jgi:hypothetical protein